MRVVVLGAGYAGLGLVRRLERTLPDDVELTLVDESPTHLVQHEVHRVVRRPSLADVVRVPLADVLDRAELVVDRVQRVDRDARQVHLEDGGALEYDYAAVCLGAETAYHDLPGVREHGMALKRVHHAEAIRSRFLDVCEAGGTAVVGGAGLSGVQVAGELAALAEERDADVSVVVLEQLDSVAPSFPEPFQHAVREELEARGVDVRTDVAVSRASADTVETAAGAVACDQLVWTGGIAGGSAMDADRPVVRGDLRLDPHTFALGDAARVVDADGEPVPASAAAAIRQAPVVAANLVRLVDHEREGEGFAPHMKAYRGDVPGWIVSVGDGAVAQVGPQVLRGRAAKAMKATVGAGHLAGVGAISEAAELVEAEL